MVRIQFAIDLLYDVSFPGTDFVFNIHAAPTLYQRIVDERLQLNQPLPSILQTDPASQARYLRLSAPAGQLQVSYQATLDIDQHVGDPDGISETPVARLPLAALTYIYPSRYCQSDRLGVLAMKEFGDLPKGYRRVEAIQNWVRRQVAFRSNSSNANTSALDTLTDRVGVCRDFAHLMIALCRALSIPARFTTGIDFGADPALGPTDFHAYVEVFLDGRWYLFDPSGTAIPMGFIRIGTGRDAADVSYATIFGSVSSPPPLISVSALSAPGQPWEIPRHRSEALSTDASPALAA
ncbi:MAG: transglutaminase family protein [Dechloromonas sp.]|nr:MAG: transglutaminase family protein [Dechloromonas sp.]